MSHDTFVIPVRIMLKKRTEKDISPFSASGLYNNMGEELLLVKSPEPIIPKFTQEICYSYSDNDFAWESSSPRCSVSEAYVYSDNIFTEQISISTVDDANIFLKQHSHLLFCTPDSLLSAGYGKKLGEDYLITGTEYLYSVLSNIKSFHLLREAYQGIADATGDLRNKDKLHAAFEKFLNFLISQHPNASFGSPLYFGEKYDIGFDGDNPFITLIRGESSDDKMRLKLSACKTNIHNKIAAEISGVYIEQNLDDFAFEYHCPTLSSAMYEKMLLSVFNKDEYRQCVKCSAYFKVDKHHPQTLCDKHMAARRRKRQNAKSKEKADEAASWIES